MSLRNTLAFIWQHPVGSRRRWASLRDFIRWQVGARVLRRPVVMPFVNDSRLLVEVGMTGATGNLYVGLHEFEDMSFALHLLRRDELLVDVGANIGSYTVLAAAGIGARCIAFEPIPRTYTHLLDNVRLNGVEDRVRARMHGVGAEPGQVVFTAGLDTVNHVATAAELDGGDLVEVPVETLDRVLEEDRPTLLKLDVEGFEEPVLGGATRTLQMESLLAVIVELNGSGRRYGHREVNVRQRLEQAGFVSCEYQPFSRTLASESDTQRGGNVIFVRRTHMDEVRRRLREAPPFRVKGLKI